MKRHLFSLALIVCVLPAAGRERPALPAELSDYVLTPAPPTKELLLRKGDRLAICGDSITEQKRYSLIIETYLTACVPELEITCRQYGWSGERASGFLNRMKSDVLRFEPTIATTCYGMNDFRYVPFDEKIAEEYRKNQGEVVKNFREADCRVLVGSSGTIDSVPRWVKNATGTQKDLNLSLCKFRNIALEVAKAGGASFADVYTPMLLADHAAKKKYGPQFKVCGKDGVHPGWTGQVVMAYAFLDGLGLDGDLGGVSFDEASGVATARNGHEIVSVKEGKIVVKSTRLPFSPGPGPVDNDDSIRAGLALVPFDYQLNRFALRVSSPKAARYKVTWGKTSREYSAAELSRGVNLAEDFDDHPLVPAFKKVWDAALAKQKYETTQIKKLVHGKEGRADLEGTFARTEKVRAPLAEAVQKALVPVEHTIVIEALAAGKPQGALAPLMAVPDQVAWQSDFSQPAALKKTEWSPRQGTRWEITDGVLRGQQSSPEFQARKKDHKGLEPRISAPVTPSECVAQFSVRFLDGEENRIVPFVEFGHHIARLRFSATNGVELLADYETTRVAHAPDFKYEPGKWYHCQVELKGDEFLVQFTDGPALYARHECFAKSVPSGGSGFGLAGPRKGLAELDNVTFWTVKGEAQDGWEKTRAGFPKFEPVKVKEKPVKKPKQSR